MVWGFGFGVDFGAYELDGLGRLQVEVSVPIQGWALSMHVKTPHKEPRLRLC